VGGKRALLLAANNPDRYAGIAVYEPITSGKNEKGPINFVNNFYNIPVFISHGRNDLQSPIENSRNFIREASECGFHPEYTETEGGHLEFSKDSRTGAFDFFANLKGKKTMVPEIIKFSTYDLNNCSSYWIKIDKIYPDSKATIKAVWNKKNNRIDIDCENITRFTVLLKKLSFTGEGEIVIYVNGKLVSKEKPEQGILSVDL